MRTLFFFLVVAVSACAQHRLDNGCPNNAASVLAYLPPGTGPASRLVPVCLALGPGLAVVNGKLTTTAAAQALRVDRFPLSAFAPFPADGSPRLVSVTLSAPMISGTAVLAFVSGQTPVALDAHASAGGSVLQLVLDAASYGAPGAEVVVVYASSVSP